MLELFEEKKLLMSFPELAQLGYSFFSLTIADQQFLITIKKLPYIIFRIEGNIGSGDNGGAYRAIQIETNTVVAIKNSFAHLEDAFHVNNASMLVRVVKSKNFNLNYFERKTCSGAKLALELLGDHPSITRVFYTGIGLRCHELQNSFHCDNTHYSILEYAHKLDAMDSIYPDIDTILKIITDLYDAQRHFLELGVGFEDNDYGNFLFADGRIKYTDFENNIISWKDPLKDSMYCRMFISMRRHFFRRFWPGRAYNLTYNYLFDNLENDLIELCRNETLCQQRDEFLSHMKNITYHFSLALCQDRGHTKNACQNQFSFFVNPNDQRNKYSLIAPFFGSITIQIFRDLLKKILSNSLISDKTIDHGINLSLIAIMLKTQDSMFPTILALMNQALTTTGVLSSKMSSLLTTIISFTAGTITAYANGDYYSAYSFAKDLSTSTLSSLSGIICYEGIKIINRQIEDRHFARSAPCAIL